MRLKRFMVLVALAFLITSVATLVLGANTRPFKKIKIAVLIPPPGRGDLGWNDMACRGAELAKEKGYAADYAIINSREESALSDLRILSQLKMYDLIVANGWQFLDAVRVVANEFPDQNFVTMDDRPKFEEGEPGNNNTIGLLFRQEQASALVGALAGMIAAQYNYSHVGIVLGVEEALLYEFEMGYKWGVNWAIDWLKKNHPNVLGKDIVDTPKKQRVLWVYTGTWADPAKGRQAAEIQIFQGAGVIYTAAGGTGLGSLEYVASHHREKNIPLIKPPYGIGVDSDQDWINPYIIASALKRIDIAILKAAELVSKGKFKETAKEKKVLTLGLEDGGVGISDEKTLEEFLDFGINTGKITSGQISKIKSDYRKLRNSQPAWIWEGVGELEKMILEDKVDIPSPFGKPEKWNIKELREEFG